MDRQTVVLKLNVTEDELWANYSSVHKRNVRKAMRSKLTCGQMNLSQGIDQFRGLYLQTMARLGAPQYYNFSGAYFDSLVTLMSDRSRVFVVKLANRIVAAGIFLLHRPVLHYHLGGSDVDHLELRPNNLLFHEVALWGLHNGYHQLHLGGGRTPDAEDGLFRFKAGIGHGRLGFCTARRIHNRPVYDHLCALWMRRSAVDSRPAYFLLYRLG
ncbi:MAG: GNAT family N-acetyltransferase [Pseudomonadota bacterium]